MSQLCQQQEKILNVLVLLVAQKDQTTKRPTNPSGSSASAFKSGDNQSPSSQSLPGLSSSEDRYPRSLPHSGPSAPSDSSGFTPFRQPPSFASPSSWSIGLSPPFSNPTASGHHQPRSSQSLQSTISHGPVSHFQAPSDTVQSVTSKHHQPRSSQSLPSTISHSPVSHFQAPSATVQSVPPKPIIF